ncbi:hypothetical protein EYF80_059469 [Liparis tanakae]|uniref:Uncharacterized protein n=1 Tax=Liparis tanakae TaxID=230148 RepID=A0A4Z2EP69_9TELE|nr:hypothetical protein EYF80_059469 [Liparis tanakae]
MHKKFPPLVLPVRAPRLQAAGGERVIPGDPAWCGGGAGRVQPGPVGPVASLTYTPRAEHGEEAALLDAHRGTGDQNHMIFYIAARVSSVSCIL